PAFVLQSREASLDVGLRGVRREQLVSAEFWSIQQGQAISREGRTRHARWPLFRPPQQEWERALGRDRSDEHARRSVMGLEELLDEVTAHRVADQDRGGR